MHSSEYTVLSHVLNYLTISFYLEQMPIVHCQFVAYHLTRSFSVYPLIYSKPDMRTSSLAAGSSWSRHGWSHLVLLSSPLFSPCSAVDLTFALLSLHFLTFIAHIQPLFKLVANCFQTRAKLVYTHLTNVAQLIKNRDSTLNFVRVPNVDPGIQGQCNQLTPVVICNQLICELRLFEGSLSNNLSSNLNGIFMLNFQL